MQRKDRKSLCGENGRGKERNIRPKEKQTSQSETSLGESLEDGSFSSGNWGRISCVNAAAEGLQKRTELMERMRQQEVQVKDSRWMEETPQRWRQPKGSDTTEMRKEEKLLRCTLLSGSAWSTEKKYMRRYKGTFGIFFEDLA